MDEALGSIDRHSRENLAHHPQGIRDQTIARFMSEAAKEY